MSPWLAPQCTHFSHHQLHIGKLPKSSSKTFIEAWGRAEARAVRRADLGGVGEVGPAGEKRPFESRSLETAAFSRPR
jgi:hypothetical protein